MNELAGLIRDWLVTEDAKVEWWVTNYNDLADLLLFGSKPVHYVVIIFEDNVMCSDYIWPYTIISEKGKQSIYASDPEFFQKLRSIMDTVEKTIESI